MVATGRRQSSYQLLHFLNECFGPEIVHGTGT